MAGSKKGKNQKIKEHNSKSQKQNFQTYPTQPKAEGNINDDEVSPNSLSGPIDANEEDQIYYEIYAKLEDAFKSALERLMTLNYDSLIAEKALLGGGHIIGDEDLVTNIVRSSIAYIENCTKIDGEYFPDDIPSFENISDLVSVWMETLEKVATDLYPDDTLRHILSCKLLASSDETAGGETDFDILLRNNIDEIVEDLGLTARLPTDGPQKKATTAMERKQISKGNGYGKNLKPIMEVEWLNNYASVREWFDNSPDEDDEKVNKLKILVKYFEVQKKEKQEWAEKKEREVDEKQTHHSLLLSKLTLDTLVIGELRKEKKDLETVEINKILEMDSEIKRGLDHIFFLYTKKDELKKDASELSADLSVWKEDIVDIKKNLKKAVKKEKKDLKIIETNGSEIIKLQEKIAEEKPENIKLDRRLQDAKKAQKKIQLSVKKEKEAKEKAIHLCSEKKRQLRMEKEVGLAPTEMLEKTFTA